MDPIYPSPTSSEPLPDSLAGQGNAYADLTTFVDLGIKADDYSIEVTVTGNLDDSLAGGAPLRGAEVKAVWYYELLDGTDYTIRTRDNMGPGFSHIEYGTAWFANAYSGEDGKVLLHYTLPKWDVAAGESAYIYIYAAGSAGFSPASDYKFTYKLPEDGTKSVFDYADECVTCSARHYMAISDVDVYSDDVSYTVNGSITGDLPESVTVYCISPSGIEVSKTISPVAGTLTFSFTVKAGTSCKIGINDLPGYTFTPQSQQMASAYSDTVFASVSVASSSDIDRAVPVVLDTYEIVDAKVGDIFSFRYSVAGTNLNVQKRADAANINVIIHGWNGNVSDSFVISADNKYIKWNTDRQIRVSGMTSIDVVTYFNSTADQPEIGNVVGAQTIQIYCEDVAYATVLTDTNGKATANIPDIPEISFRKDGLAVSSTAITTGAYAGCIGLNLKEVIPSPESSIATITIRYIATSSLQNETTPTNIDILSGPITSVLTVGETKDFTAPDVEGFTFSGWYINGTSVSNARDLHICNLRVTADMDGGTLVASYSANDPEPPKPDYGTVFAIGALAVTISIIALIFVILQVRRY